MESTVIQAPNQKDKGLPCQKEGGKQGRSPSGFYQQATTQPTSPRGENNTKNNSIKPYSPSYMIPKIQKYSMDYVFNLARTFMEFKEKEEQRMR
ncbi:hypothetical protein O181_003625 [Austropuccinia psidii MF-1]|uniref:Uncharacterized protein n=1 Tax=Austropuccinia psidii MF-1 TaxID=1389203 RepID=A0A9Q3BES7_9BASI|nr:hypothetical protein [Austropuccinia psidii MF-1]